MMRPLSPSEVGRLERAANEAKREAESLRAELDEQRRKEERERDERERERKERMRAMLPSNRLHNGEISDPVEAIRAHIASMEHEARLWVPARPDEDLPDYLKGDPWPAWIAEAKECLKEYEGLVVKARRDAERALVTVWLAQGGEIRTPIANAIQSGDFTSLAI